MRHSSKSRGDNEWTSKHKSAVEREIVASSEELKSDWAMWASKRLDEQMLLYTSIL